MGICQQYQALRAARVGWLAFVVLAKDLELLRFLGFLGFSVFCAI
jgi:hypothetical protein